MRKVRASGALVLAGVVLVSTVSLGAARGADRSVGPYGGCELQRDVAAVHVVEEHFVMDDGTKLAANVFRPSEDGGATPISRRLPVILQPTPYGKDLVPPRVSQAAGNEFAWWRYGYALVAVDLRGTGSSEGRLDDNIFSDREVRDVIAVINAITEKEWSNGKVGIAMQSYTATLGMLVAGHPEAPEGLSAISAAKPVLDLYRDAAHPGGILPATMYASWMAFQEGANRPSGLTDDNNTLAAITAKLGHRPPGSFVPDFLARPTDGPFYRQRSAVTNARKINVPVFYTEGWYDGFVSGMGRELHKLLESWPAGSRVWVDSFTHGGTGSEEAQANPEWYDAETQFMDIHLKGCPPVDYPRVKLRVVGPTDTYVTGRNWPLERVRFERRYLDASDTLTDRPIPGEESFAAHATDGWTNTFGRHPNIGATPYRPLDQNLERSAGLVWETPVEEAPFTVSGPLALHLRAASTAPDTDWIVKVSLVGPTSARLLAEGQLRASHRQLDASESRLFAPYHSHVDPTPIARGEFYDYDIAVSPLTVEVAPGYKLRLQLTSNDSPTRLHANVRVSPDGTVTVVPHEPATNTVRYGLDGSWVSLPILRSPLSEDAG